MQSVGGWGPVFPAAFCPVEMATGIYLLSDGSFSPGPFRLYGGPPLWPLLLAGSKMELLGEACGIWDLSPVPERRLGRPLPSPQLAGRRLALQTLVVRSCD